MKRRALLAGFAAGPPAVPRIGRAQGWSPTRPVRLVLG
jgi:hypothetical protein